MEPTIEELRKNYERYDDGKLIRIATEEADRLRPEAVALIKQIIKERGLSDDIIKGVDVQLKQLDEKAILGHTDFIRKQPCPICNSTTEKLNAAMIATTISFIILSSYSKELKIACPDCLDKQHATATLKTALLGWWGIPWGIIRSVKSLTSNYKMKKQNHLFEASDLLKAFVIQRAGRIEAVKNNPEELQSLIKHIR